MAVITEAQLRVYQADFCSLDADGSGLLDLEEASALVRGQLAKEPSVAELCAFMKEFDINGSNYCPLYIAPQHICSL